VSGEVERQAVKWRPVVLHQSTGYGRKGERWPFDEREMKGVGRRFGLAPSGCRRVAHGSTWRGGADRRGGGGSGVQRWEKTPGGPTSAGGDRELSQCGKNPKENENGLLMRSGPKCGLGFRMDF
jgi:hypothetical protein